MDVKSKGTAAQATGEAGSGHRQRMIVIRHGERLDNVDGSWMATTERPYDPPITDEGVAEAKSAGERFVEKEVKYIISSPFLRCLQTANCICTALKLPGIITCNQIVDVLSRHCGIQEQPIVPDSEAVTKEGIKILQQDDSPLPRFPERTSDGLKRFIPEFNRLADKYWPHNIVIVTHGYGVMRAVLLAQKQIHPHNIWVEYCGHIETSRTDRDCHEWTLEGHANIFLSSGSLS